MLQKMARSESTDYNALPRPGMVLVNGDQAEWIKRPEAVADAFMRDLEPERLRVTK
jgi:diaminopimelate decarboxylase